MKKMLVLWILILGLALGLSACGGSADTEDTGGTETQETTNGEPAGTTEAVVTEETKSAGTIDVDLTKMSATMVYSEVYDMMYTPENYVGKTVKMEGQCATYEDPDTGKHYYACIIQDATACCSQGVEFALASSYEYPADYPIDGKEVTVTGVFTTYEEEGETYCTLADAQYQ